MKIHEYQGKALLTQHGVATPRGEPVFSVDEATAAAERLGGGRVVVKAQIHAGGRGKGGGVKLADDPTGAARIAGEMLGMTLVTAQTGPAGRVVSRVLVEQGLDIAAELYLGLLIDRAQQRPLLMASAAGGMDIEQVAADTPELIHRV
ncbi:MAG: succinate--CoA ligase subunit beta, partial [Vicinamibacterales bacterium]|nr:succinate--CoA ligase subunit beta [Vicinamibacterales bacterium]